MECTPRGPLLLTSLLHLEHGCLCLLLGYMPLIPSFLDSFNLIGLGLGLPIKGELPDGTPYMILVSRYKSVLCADLWMHLQVSRLFFSIPFIWENSLLATHLSRSTAHRLCSTPHDCLVFARSLHRLVFGPQRLRSSTFKICIHCIVDQGDPRRMTSASKNGKDN